MSFDNKEVNLTNNHDAIELLDITNKFASLTIIKQNAATQFYNLRIRGDILKNEYTNYVTRNKSKMHFGLDSFHFQSTMLEYEFKTLWNQFQMILNRIYCEYYKFLKILIKYVTDTFADEPALILLCNASKYPVYKDLEPSKEYDFGIISSLFDNIVKIVHYLINMHNNNSKIINEIYSSNDGFNIENYVDTLVFNTAILNEKIKLYEKYLNVFNKYHVSYLSRLDIKLSVLWGQVNYDLNAELDKKPTKKDYIQPQINHDIMLNNGLSIKSIKEFDNIFTHIGEIEEPQDVSESMQTLHKDSIHIINHINDNQPVLIPSPTITNMINEAPTNIFKFNQIEELTDEDNNIDEIEQSLRLIHPVINNDYRIIEETHIDQLDNNESQVREIEQALKREHQNETYQNVESNEPIIDNIEEPKQDSLNENLSMQENQIHHETKLQHVEEQVIHYGTIAVNQVVDILENEKLKKKLKKARHKFNIKSKKFL